MIRFLKSPRGVLSVLVLLFFAVALSLTASVQATQIEYEKVDHPPKLEGVLARIQKNWAAQKRALAKATARQYGAADIDGENITVVLEPRDGQLSESIDFGALSNLGVSIVAQSRHLVAVSSPISALERLTHVAGVQFVRLPIKPRPLVVSEGVARVKASVYSRRGFTGRGVKVGVIDIGFVGVPSLQNRGELPQVFSRDFTGGGIFERGSLSESAMVHGSACAEIVHDIAPDAEIHLYKVADMVSLENAKDAAIQEGLDIVTVSLGWDFARGFGDGTGRACEIVDDAFQNNVLWVNAAGNEAKRKISAQLSDPDGDGYHNFEGDDEIVSLKNVRVGDEVKAVLTWNEWPLTSHDYDLLLVKIATDGSTEIIERADTKQSYSPPFELLAYTIREPGNYGLAVWRAEDAKVTLFKLISPSHDLDGPISIAGSLSSPGDARGALTVGALGHRNYTTGPIESYSSQGPTFDRRIKPDLVAPTGVSTVSYGPPGYYGTSAAAPHVAGAAALVKSSDPVHYNARRLKDALMRSAVDMGDRGPDNVYGAGRLELLPLFGMPIMNLSRTELDFGAVLLGQSQTLELGIVNPGQASLVITNILLPSRDYDLSHSSYTVAPGRSGQISVTFSPQSLGDKSGAMTILSNLPDRTVTLRARGVQQPVVPAPQLSVDSSLRDFGRVEIGTSKSMTVTVTNFGDAALSITDIITSDDQVGAIPKQLTIPAKQNGFFTLRFEPNRTGDLSGNATIYSNDPQTPAVSIRVSGTGYRPQTTRFALSLVTEGTENNGVYALPADGVIAVQIHGQQVKDAIGFRALFNFDAPALAYEGFDIGNGIPNGHSPGPYSPPNSASAIEVMAASFGSKIAQPSAWLGTIRFRASDAFYTGQIRLRQARIRRAGQFEVFADPLVLTFSRQRGLRADFNGNGNVGFQDFLLFASHYGYASGQANYDVRYDLDGDGRIGFGDFLIFAQDYGQP